MKTGGAPMDRYIYLDVAGDSAEIAAVRDAIEAATDPYPLVDVMDRDELAEEQPGHIKRCSRSSTRSCWRRCRA